MTYTATVKREGRDWLAEVPGLDGAHTFALTLNRLRAELADAIILADELPDDADVEIAFKLDGGDPLIAQAFALADERREIHRAEAQLVANTARLAQELVDAGWSVRDAAGALDVTPGRVSQLARAHA